AIDRPTLAQVQTQGLAPVADSYYSPNSDMHARLASDIPQFPYDPARAQQLLTEAGWVRGSDGVLVSQSSGERFETEVRADRAGGSEKAQEIGRASCRERGERAGVGGAWRKKAMMSE